MIKSKFHIAQQTQQQLLHRIAVNSSIPTADSGANSSNSAKPSDDAHANKANKLSDTNSTNTTYVFQNNVNAANVSGSGEFVVTAGNAANSNSSSNNSHAHNDSSVAAAATVAANHNYSLTPNQQHHQQPQQQQQQQPITLINQSQNNKYIINTTGQPGGTSNITISTPQDVQQHQPQHTKQAITSSNVKLNLVSTSLANVIHQQSPGKQIGIACVTPAASD